ncbi:MAG: hypothetical protein AB1429_13270 [Pseudomonadota bacterium]|jgi:hypothetical protein
MQRTVLALALALGTPMAAIAAEAPGDTYTYVSESREQDQGPDGASSQTNRLTFELKVLAVTPQSVRQRFTLKSADATDSQGPSVQTAMRAMVDDPLDFDLAPDGTLVGLPGWDGFKTRLLAKLDQSLPASDPVRGRTHEMLDGDPADTAQRLVIGDTQAMAASQAAARLADGKVELPSQEEPIPGGGKLTSHASIEVSHAGVPACQVRVTRIVASDAAPKDAPAEHVEVTSEALISTVDGRVVSFTQHRTSRAADGSASEDLTIRRTSPLPACAK